LVLGSSVAAWGACDPDGADAADIAAARAAIEAACDCEGAPNHGAYVRCARNAARAALSNKRCLGRVVQCASRSTCGRPGAVACCRTNAKGRTRASIKRNASLCRAPRNGSACVSSATSLCDACGEGDCNAPTPVPTATQGQTTSPTPAPSPTPSGEPVCGNGVVEAGEECDGATCTALLDEVEVQSECGAPGTAHACQCRNVQCGGCFGYPGDEGVLCWADDQCLISPGGPPGCIPGMCVPTTCQTSAECTAGSSCENGLCCVAGFEPPAFCRVYDQVELPCCGAAVCGAGELAVCCMPTGESCTNDAMCCSGSCVGGICQ